MKKIILSSIMAFALLFSTSVMAQDSTPKDSKSKKECCSKKDGEKKECTKSTEKSTSEKKSCCTAKDKK